MSKYVLDASALLALLNNESGAKRVNDILPESVVGAVNVCEVVGKLTGAGISLDDARTSIELLRANLSWLRCPVPGHDLLRRREVPDCVRARSTLT